MMRDANNLLEPTSKSGSLGHVAKSQRRWRHVVYVHGGSSGGIASFCMMHHDHSLYRESLYVMKEVHELKDQSKETDKNNNLKYRGPKQKNKVNQQSVR